MLAGLSPLREAIGSAKGEAAAVRATVQHEREARSRAEVAVRSAQAEASAQRGRAARALGELEDVELATEYQHPELAQMRREVAEARTRAVAVKKQIVEAARLRTAAEAAVEKARSWIFLNVLLRHEEKGRR